MILLLLFYLHRRYDYCLFTSFDEERVRLFPLHVDFRYQFVVDVPDDVTGGITCDLKKQTKKRCYVIIPATNRVLSTTTWRCFINLKKKTIKIKIKIIFLMYITATTYNCVVVTKTHRIKAIFFLWISC